MTKLKKGEIDDIFCYELDDENWRPTNILSEHVDHSKEIREFINVFEVEVQKLEADQFQLGTCTHWYSLMSCLIIAIR
jgi:DNA-directed RNA polymerase II subunit RPB1